MRGSSHDAGGTDKLCQASANSFTMTRHQPLYWAPCPVPGLCQAWLPLLGLAVGCQMVYAEWCGVMARVQWNSSWLRMDNFTNLPGG